MESVWQKNTKKTNFQRLDGDKSTDVLIIGGGIAGILCAYQFKKAGVDCILTEATEICNGITKNTTAKITLQHGAIFDKMIKRFGRDKAQLYVDAQVQAIKEYEKLCKNIDCDYETKDAYVYSLDNSKKIEKESVALNKLGIKADFLGKTELPFEIAGAVRVENQGQFNPLKFLFNCTFKFSIYGFVTSKYTQT